VRDQRRASEEKGQRVALEQADEPLVANVDGDRVRQVLGNLVSNAIKFTPAGGRIAVEAAASGDDVVLSVTDTGIGVAPEEAERLFERFFRARSATDRAIPGTGLGLAISKAIVDAHGGRIGVESEEGKGTTFAVDLPADG
jgi:signal transduction histidine kinase